MKYIRLWGTLGIIVIWVAINVLLFQSKGTIDARNFEAIFQDVLVKGSRFVPDCLNYLCTSNYILAKFPPLHALLFYLFSLIFPVSYFGTLISLKALIVVFYILTLFSSVWFAKRVGNAKMSYIGVIVLYGSLLSLVLNTQGLAYTDVLTFPFFILSVLFLLQKKYFFSGCMFGLSCLIKWQPIIVLPLFFVYLLPRGVEKQKVFPIFQFVCGLAISIILMYPFTHEILSGLVLSLRNALLHTQTYALNVQWVLQNLPWKVMPLAGNESPSIMSVMTQLGVFIMGYIVILWRVFDDKDTELVKQRHFLHSLLMALGVYFFFSFGVHENHFILGTIVALLLYIYHPTKKNLFLLRIVDGINILNMGVLYGVTGVSWFPEHVQGIDLSVLIAFAVSAVSITYFYVFELRNAHTY